MATHTSLQRSSSIEGVGALTAAALESSLRAVGIAERDTVFVHLSLDSLGTFPETATETETNALVLNALLNVIGPNGTILVPTYTFSFCEGQIFDVENTPTKGGPWSRSASFLEYFRTLPGTTRSEDPIHSVAGRGPAARKLLENLPATCFGPESLPERLLSEGAKICLLGLPLEEATFRHYIEEAAGVPFRYKKLFTGRIRKGGTTRRTGWIYSVRILAENGTPSGDRLEERACVEGICRSAPLGMGKIRAVNCDEFARFTREALHADPWLTARGPAVSPEAAERARVAEHVEEIELPPNASMATIIDRLWRSRRDIVSSGYDAALRALATQLPMKVHEYPSGTECWSWIVPERWTCDEACLESVSGDQIFSTSDHPLHVVSYSLPFSGVVSRQELLAHLHVHPRLPDAVPFIFKYYERDWGLCCTHRQRESLNEEHYRVRIRTSFSFGTLKVGEVIVRGSTDESVVLCAHLCHPHMVNDDLTGVAVGLDVMRALMERRNLRYTYRLLIVPETIGSIAYLSHHEGLIPLMKGGLFLEMLGRSYPHALQHSFVRNSEVDRCFARALADGDPHGWTGEYRSIIGNDERQFNAPGVRVPMLSLSRVLPVHHAESPYREYHSSEDTPELVPPHSLPESRDLVLRMIDTLEANRTPINVHKGELFCSRYGIHIDAYEDPQGNRTFFDLLDLIDGTRSLVELADACKLPFESVRRTCERLHQLGLIQFVN